MGKFELSLSPNYAAGWTLTDAVRELFQNALDQQTLYEDNAMFTHYDGVHMLQIGNKSSVLEAKTLLLGSSTKADNEETIGQFGEGYKIATLVLLRLGKDVKFYNYGKKEIWKPRFVKSRKYQGELILTFETEAFFWGKRPNNDLTIAIDGITPEEYEDIIKSNLHLQDVGETISTDRGRILLDASKAGQVFVNGLYVTKIGSLAYGYDFKPKYLPLGRDRNMVRSIDIMWETSEMWRMTEDDRVLDLIKEGKEDVMYLKKTYSESPIKATVKEKIVSEFVATYGEKAIPVTSQVEADEAKIKYKDAEPIIVNQTYKHVLNQGGEYVPKKAEIRKRGNDPESMQQRLELWFKKAAGYLPGELSNQFKTIMKDMKQEVK